MWPIVAAALFSTSVWALDMEVESLVPSFGKYVVAVQDLVTGDDGAVCLGSILSSNKVLTGAHCVWRPKQDRAKFFIMRMPFRTLPSIPVVKIHFHPEFVLGDGPHNTKADLAILELEQDISSEPLAIMDSSWPDLYSDQASDYTKCGLVTARVHVEEKTWAGVFLPMTLWPARWDHYPAAVALQLRVWTKFRRSLSTENTRIAWPVKFPILLDGGAPYTCEYRGERRQVGLQMGSHPWGIQFMQSLYPYLRWIRSVVRRAQNVD